MKYTCGACKYAGETAQMTMVTPLTEDQDYEIHCPRCFQLLVSFPSQGAVSLEDDVDKYLPTSDQCRYSLHLYQKQLDKLQHGIDQLNEMTPKTQVLLELANEREAEDEE